MKGYKVLGTVAYRRSVSCRTVTKNDFTTIFGGSGSKLRRTITGRILRQIVQYL